MAGLDPGRAQGWENNKLGAHQNFITQKREVPTVLTGLVFCGEVRGDPAFWVPAALLFGDRPGDTSPFSLPVFVVLRRWELQARPSWPAGCFI